MQTQPHRKPGKPAWPFLAPVPKTAPADPHRSDLSPAAPYDAYESAPSANDAARFSYALHEVTRRGTF